MAIPNNQKMMLLSALSLVSAALGQLAEHYANKPEDHKTYDFLVNFQQGLFGFQQQIQQL